MGLWDRRCSQRNGPGRPVKLIAKAGVRRNPLIARALKIETLPIEAVHAPALFCLPPEQNRKHIAESPGIVAPAQPVTLRRIDPEQNMARFYALEVERDLIGRIVLARRWGRIGTGGAAISLFLQA